MKSRPDLKFEFTKRRCCRMYGPLGQALDLCIKNQLLQTDWQLLSSPFLNHSDDDGGWRGEFWGKTVRSAVLAWSSTRDPQLFQCIRIAVDGILEAIGPDGCISSVSAGMRLRKWDLWGRKYVLLGLERYYLEIQPDDNVKIAIQRILDRIINEVHAKKNGILATGEHEGLASSSLIGAVAEAWRITGEKRYLEFAREIIQSGCSAKHDIFLAVRQGIPPSEIGDAKAYEMLSCFKGVSEMLDALPDAYRSSVLCCYQAVRDHEIMITGTGGATNFGETWFNGRFRQTWNDIGKLGETCVTVTWIQYCGSILSISGDSAVADEMERAAYNALLGGMKPDGSNWTHRNPTPLSAPAPKNPSDDQMLRNFGTPFDGHDCCRAQGPEGLAQMTRYAVMRHSGGLVINFYESLDAEAETPSGTRVAIRIDGEYPFEEDVRIRIMPEHAEHFILLLRIPKWWNGNSRLSLNGVPISAQSGQYCRIEREWKADDQIEFHFDLRPRRERDPGKNPFYAFFCGPVLMAQDSRLPNFGKPVPQVLPELYSEPVFRKTVRFSDGTMMCDYADAGNLFSAENPLQVWVTLQAQEDEK
ncbi:MAG: beta-L-arabinofuranosidase domain-containing protein [Victivallales bacterium]